MASEMFRRAFPDWRSDGQQLIAEGDLVVENFIARGTHRAAPMGETPTGHQIVLRGINIFRIAADKIVERWGRLDQLSHFSNWASRRFLPTPAASPDLCRPNPRRRRPACGTSDLR
jgi:hypothetical protein